MSHSAALKSTLQWYLEQGIDEILADAPVDRTLAPVLPSPSAAQGAPHSNIMGQSTPKTPMLASTAVAQVSAQTSLHNHVQGAAEAIEAAKQAAQNAHGLEALKDAILSFDGLSIKKTAANMVFADGNPKAHTMVIGEAPGGDEDRQGKPFVGMGGQLLDRILGCIELDRSADAPENSVYLTNMLNWRPPGNRTPTQAEVDISLPFIVRHIELVSPKVIILLGGSAGKSILDKNESISKLRGSFHKFKGAEVITTYHPDYLITTPARKKAVWQDILKVQAKLAELS